jgi:dTMP kinase
MFIEIEGIDGVGKTTQCNLLDTFFHSHHIDSVVVREPAGTDFGSKLRELIMSDVARGKVTELFSFLAAKAQLYTEVIVPALAAGKHVIADRGGLSFLSYHHLATGLDFDPLRELMKFATNRTQPTLTIVLDVSADIAMQRVEARGAKSPFDNRTKPYYEAQRAAFRTLCGILPRAVFIDGTPSQEEVNAQVRSELSIAESF